MVGLTGGTPTFQERPWVGPIHWGGFYMAVVLLV